MPTFDSRSSYEELQDAIDEVWTKACMSMHSAGTTPRGLCLMNLEESMRISNTYRMLWFPIHLGDRDHRPLFLGVTFDGQVVAGRTEDLK